MILEIVLPALAGAAVGALTGLIPGLHVNTLSAALAGAAAGSVGGAPAAALLVALAVSHEVTSFVPGTFFGAPDEATVATMLPAHEMLRQGRGVEAVELAALGCVAGFGVGVLVLWPFQSLLGAVVQSGALSGSVALLLTAVCAVMVATERRTIAGSRAAGICVAALTFLAAGGLGMAVFSAMPGTPQVLFPLLAGLFGLPPLMLAAESQAPRRQLWLPETEAPRETAISASVGGLFGAVTAVLPGLTTGAAVILAMHARPRARREQVIVTTAAASASACLYTVLAFALIARSRSGAMQLVSSFVSPEQWIAAPPPLLAPLLLACTVGVTVGACAAPWAARRVAKRIGGWRSKSVNGLVAVGVAGLVGFETGLVGLLILTAACALGLVVWKIGVRRSHLSGCLMVPIILG